MNDFTCRTAGPPDVLLLAEMNHALIRDEGHRNRHMTIDDLAKRMKGWLAGEYEAVIFTRAGRDSGYALFRREPEFVYVRQFYVCPADRRQGLGREAMEWLIRNRWSDAPRIRIDVLAGNATGRAFWRGIGFEEYCITMERERP